MTWSGLERDRFDNCVEIFYKDNLELFSLFMENVVGQRLAFVKESDVLFCISTYSDNRISHGLDGTLGLNLINNIFKLNH